tara:strand:+ start:1425 stop:1649 length:225 start_codon:yes stop_codon:yes gene_type:complete
MDYWGIDAINKKMSWTDPHSIRRKVRDEAFPAYKVRHGQHPRLWWYTNDVLINTWHLANSNGERVAILQGEYSG